MTTHTQPPARSTVGEEVAAAHVDPFVHWGHIDSRPTSLHGNGAASFEHVALDPAEVTCGLCAHLLRTTDSLSWIDRQGDVWRLSPDDGLMYTPETRPFSREHVERKWGPLRLADVVIRAALTQAPADASEGASGAVVGDGGGL